jgi:hypothetical protein
MSKVPDRARPTITSRIGVSVPSAIGALLFAGALAFGSGVIDAVVPGQGGDETAQHGSDTKPADGASQDGKGGGSGDGHETKPADSTQEDKQEPDHGTPDKTSKPEPTAKPEPTPTEQAKPKPEPAPPAPTTGLVLEAASYDGKVKLLWSAFSGDGFGGYKVVRSTDAAVAWPLGPGDGLAAYTGETWHKDFPTCGMTWFYRVFAVTGGSHAVLGASNVVSVSVACVVKPTPPPPPPPVVLGFAAEVIDGQVHLSWEDCTSEAFGAYKVVRSQTNPDPKFPLNSGTELIAAIGDHTVTSLVDGNVSSGQTWTYRVLSMANGGAGWYPIGITPAITVTIP